jgi:SAM-dependent methyltransferase
MAEVEEIKGATPWPLTPPGRYLIAWEQARMDAVLADIFGFHAVQMGLRGLDALRSNRMPQRWRLALPSELEWSPHEEFKAAMADETAIPVSLLCVPEALPFADNSLDLVVMPHTLEAAADAHRALAEAVRALRPEGHLVITGLNPMSLWGAKQGLRAWANRHPQAPLALAPSKDGLIGYWRLRDWLRLLGLEIEIAQLGCYRPPFRSEAWLARFPWLEGLGERWWPVLGAVYLIVAVKRVRGMRLVGLARTAPKNMRVPSRAVARRNRRVSEELNP